MKIGIDIRCLMEKNYSGISEYTYNLLKTLFELDKTNQYILFYNSIKPVRVPEFNYPNVAFKSFRFPNKLFNLSMRFLKIVAVDKLIGGVDVFLIPNFLFLNLSKSCRSVLIVHDLSFELYPQFFTPKKRLWHQLIGPRQLCEKSQSIIAISENTKRDIVDIFKIAPEKITVVYPGIASNFFSAVSEQQKQLVAKKYDLPEKYIFCLGNLEPRKNVESLIKAFELVEDKTVQLVIAGSLAWKYQSINKLFLNSSAKARIKFLGYVDTADKPALYALAKAFIYPSIYEGFGLPPVEAQSVGAPVIAGFNSSLVEAIGSSGLLVDQNNYFELTQVINQLLTDQKLSATLQAAGIQNAKRFSWPVAAEKILAIIQKS